MAGGAVAALGAALLFPIRSLGPRPGKDLKNTPVPRRRPPGHRRRRAGAGVGGARSAASSPPSPRATRTRPTPRRSLVRLPEAPHPPPRGPGGLGARGDPRLLEAVHPHRVPRRALPERGAAAPLPVPPVDLRRARRRPPGVRPGRPVAAAAAPRRRRRGLPRRPRRLLRPGGRRVLGPGTEIDNGARRSLGRRARRGRRIRPEAARQGLPGPLVVHDRRARPLLLHRAAAHRRVPHVLLRPEPDRGRVLRQLRAAPGRPHDRGVPVRARHQLRRAGRARHAPDPPLGGAAVRRRRSSSTSCGCSSPARSGGPAS